MELVVASTTDMSTLLENHVDPQIAESLAKQKILHVDDFLKADIDKMVTATRLRPQDVVELRLYLANRFLPNVVSGDVYYDLKLKTCAIIKTFIPSLDVILDGGLRMGTLLEICGSSGSGKTQLCLNLAIKTTAIHKIEVLYVDTKRDFVASHVSSLIDALGFSEDSDTILERIKVVKVNTIYELISMLHHLQRSCKTQKRLKIMILDSLATLYYPFIGAKTGEGNEGISLLNHVASMLKKLSVQHNMATVLVNLGTRWSPEENIEDGPDDDDDAPSGKTDAEDLKPAMGKYWSHVPNTRLFLQRDQRTAGRTIYLNECPQNKTAKFEILANDRANPRRLFNKEPSLPLNSTVSELRPQWSIFIALEKRSLGWLQILTEPTFFDFIKQLTSDGWLQVHVSASLLFPRLCLPVSRPTYCSIMFMEFQKLRFKST